nr:MAG: ORF1 [Torque teno polar bear virus 45]
MPYRRRRRRIPRRRSQLHYRRRRWIRKGRRRWHWRRGRRYSTVRVTRPKRIQWLSVRGFEFLGVQGSEIEFSLITDEQPNSPSKKGEWRIDMKNVAPSNKESVYLSKIIPPTYDFHNSCQDQWADLPLSYWDFVGGFGQAEFTLRSLLLRAIFGFARFSRKLEDVQYIKFIGFKFNMIRAPTIDYIFLPEPHRGSYDYEKSLIHPANLLNTKGAIIVNSLKRTKCCRTPRVKKRADPTIFGWHDLEDFLGVRLTGYVWSIIQMNNPIGRNSQITRNLKSPVTNNWFREKDSHKTISTFCPLWMNREKYDKVFVQTIDRAQSDQFNKNWYDWIFQQDIKDNQVDCDYGKYTPFVPPVTPAPQPQTLWFRYVFLFQVAGRTFGRTPPGYPVRETDVCEPCAPSCDACIYPEDLDKWGLLKEKAYKRIIRSPQRTKKRMVEIIARALRERKRKRERRVTFEDDQKNPKKRCFLGF